MLKFRNRFFSLLWLLVFVGSIGHALFTHCTYLSVQLSGFSCYRSSYLPLDAMDLSREAFQLARRGESGAQKKPCAWLERARCKGKEEQGKGASGVFNEVSGRQDEPHLRNSLVVAQEYLLVCLAVLA